MHAVNKVELNIRKNCPPHGLVQVISVTERQFAAMQLVVGETDEINVQNDSRMIVL